MNDAPHLGHDQVLPEWPNEENAPAYTRGWHAFWTSQAPPDRPADALGYWRAYARAYALGWDECQKPDDTRDDCGPYPQFSGPWEAWADGWNDNSRQVGEAITERDAARQGIFYRGFQTEKPPYTDYTDEDYAVFGLGRYLRLGLETGCAFVSIRGGEHELAGFEFWITIARHGKRAEYRLTFAGHDLDSGATLFDIEGVAAKPPGAGEVFTIESEAHLAEILAELGEDDETGAYEWLEHLTDGQAYPLGLDLTHLPADITDAIGGALEAANLDR